MTKDTIIAGQRQSGRRFRQFSFSVLFLLLFVCGGCSSFNRDWRRAAHLAQKDSGLDGRWQGQWVSESNGHHGELRCLMSSTNETATLARFRATYGHMLHFSYTVPLQTQRHDLGWEFNGEANLGKLAGGVYYYEGRATTTNLISTYKSKYDHGRFELHRLQP